MDINKRNRTELKSYFVKNAIPTASNFADLIEGALNQKDDGIVKLPGDPLSIEAAGDATSLKKAINFYRNFSDANPDWTINLNPRSNPNDASTGKLGFNISDGEGNSRLFIDRTTGNVGVGTTSPGAKLHLGGPMKIDGNNTLEFGAGVNGKEVNAGKIGYQTFTADALDIVGAGATGTSRKIRLWAEGGATVAGSLTLTGNVGIGTTTIHNPQGWNKVLDILGTSNARLNVRSSGGVVTSVFSHDNWDGARGAIGTDSNHPLTFATNYIHRMTIDTAGNVGIGTTMPKGFQVALPESSKGNVMPGPGVTIAGGPQGNASIELRNNGSGTPFIDFALDGTSDFDTRIRLVAKNQFVIEGAHVGIGATSPVAKLDVMHSARSGTHPSTVNGLYVTGDFAPAANGVEFRHSNGTQGIGFGYNTIYATGTNPNQDLNLMPRGTGNVGIGTTTPSHKFHVVAADAVGLFESSGGQAYLRLSTNEGLGNRVEITNRPGGRLSLWTSGAGDVFNITKDGNVGIGTTSPAMPLHIKQPKSGQGIWLDEADANGNLTRRNFRIYYEGQGTIVFYHQDGQGQFMPANGTWNRNSDLALKENITPLSGVLDNVLKLRPVNFTWKSNKGEDIGFVAQDVEHVFPQLVSSVNIEGKQLKGLPYAQFAVLAIAAIQEQQALIGTLQEEINDLKRRI